ncbi:hypothetical protein CYMTET_20485 [Cymbomonas tetramitiformis]|uniref:DUF4336 domain-containing protein n=1 Tax=Cymbomonas tetramitiformis TaxID=36881 RepID=A0AAE0G417_9CHLO|nr:hypothetical protein CYMTET_20485 [Cymbomonas tetramitiformis]
MKEMKIVQNGLGGFSQRTCLGQQEHRIVRTHRRGNVKSCKSFDVRRHRRGSPLFAIRKVSFSVASASPQPSQAATAPGKNRSYIVFPPPLFPLVPAFSRPTFRYEVDPGRIWVFEQKQGIGLGLNVSVNVRMTVIKMKNGGLWIHAPIAPTAECIKLVKDLDAPVEYIVLPTTLFEHKLFVGPFSREFPKAKVYVAPGQWSFPLQLPPSFFGIFPTGFLDEETFSDLPWADEIQQQLLQPPPLGINRSVKFNEIAFFHKATRTLLVTDAVVYVSDNIPDVITERDLMESGDDGNFAITCLKLLNLFGIAEKARLRSRTSNDMTTDEVRDLGWKRNALQALYFGPENLLDPEGSWKKITNRLIVAPVVGTLVYENIPDYVLEWVDRVCKWNFKRIIPCHFDAPIQATPREFREAFLFLGDGKERASYPEDRPQQRPRLPFGPTWKRSPQQYYPEDDMVLIRGVAQFLIQIGIIFTKETRPKPLADLNSQSRDIEAIRK